MNLALQREQHSVALWASAQRGAASPLRKRRCRLAPFVRPGAPCSPSSTALLPVTSPWRPPQPRKAPCRPPLALCSPPCSRAPPLPPWQCWRAQRQAVCSTWGRPAGFSALHAAVAGRCRDALPALVAAGAPLDGVLHTSMYLAIIAALRHFLSPEELAESAHRRGTLKQTAYNLSPPLGLAIACVPPDCVACPATCSPVACGLPKAHSTDLPHQLCLTPESWSLTCLPAA